MDKKGRGINPTRVAEVNLELGLLRRIQMPKDTSE